MRIHAMIRAGILVSAALAAACSASRPAPVAAPAPFVQAAAPAAPPAPESRPVIARLLESYDRDGDGRVSRAEYARTADAFKNLDRDGDGFVTAKDMERPVEMPPDLAAPFLIVRRFAGPEEDSIGVGDLAEAFEAADENKDGALSRAEFIGPAPAGGPDRFAPLLAVADLDRDGSLQLAELEAYARKRDKNDDGRISRRERMKPGADPPTGRFEAAVRARAPDFTLPNEDGSGTVTLSSFAGKRPVALIFGSFT
jgi:Ca2+-binding EF-hand superfamily protein